MVRHCHKQRTKMNNIKYAIELIEGPEEWQGRCAVVYLQEFTKTIQENDFDCIVDLSNLSIKVTSDNGSRMLFTLYKLQ